MEWIAQLLNLLPPGYQRWLQQPEVLLALSEIVLLPPLALLWWKINKKAEAIEREIGELRHDNNRLTRENEELKGSLKSLISSVEDCRLSELPNSFQGVGKKLDAILETGRVPAKPRSPAIGTIPLDPSDDADDGGGNSTGVSPASRTTDPNSHTPSASG